MSTFEPTYTPEEKEVVLKEVDAAGFPRINAFTDSRWTPELLGGFLKKEGIVTTGAMKHVTPLQMEAIFCAVSAANSCELCLTFHAMGMKEKGATEEDINAIVHQGMPASKDIYGHVYASKLALSHKGIFLPREKEYLLKEYGIGPCQLCEIIYLVGQIAANNMLMVHMISEDVPLDDMLQGFSPFAKTAFGK